MVRRLLLLLPVTLMLLCVGSTNCIAFPKADIVVTGIPDPVKNGDLLRGAVTITLSEFTGPVKIQVFVTVDGKDAEVTLLNRSNGVHKIALSTDAPIRMDKQPVAYTTAVKVSAMVFSQGSDPHFRQISAPVNVAGAPPKYLQFLDKDCAAKTGGRVGDKCTLILRYAVDNSGKAENVSITELVSVTGPQTLKFQPVKRTLPNLKGRSIVTSNSTSTVLKQPGTYYWTVTVQAAGYQPSVYKTTTVVKPEQTSRKLSITKAVVTPQSAKTGTPLNFAATITATADFKEALPVVLKSTITGPEAADDAQTLAFTNSSNGEETARFLRTFNTPGKYTWKMTAKSPDLPDVTETAYFTIKQAPKRDIVAGSQWWVCDKPVVTTQDQYGNWKEAEAPEGMSVDLGANTVTFDVMEKGRKVTNIIRFTPPDLRLQDGWGVELTLSCMETNPNIAAFSAQWSADGINAAGFSMTEGQVLSVPNKKHAGGGSMLSGTTPLEFKPGSSKPEFSLMVSQSNSMKRNITIFWRYKKEPKP